MMHAATKTKVTLEKYTFSVDGKENWGCSTCNITRTQISLLLKTMIFKHDFCHVCPLPSSNENEHLIILLKS